MWRTFGLVDLVAIGVLHVSTMCKDEDIRFLFPEEVPAGRTWPLQY